MKVLSVPRSVRVLLLVILVTGLTMVFMPRTESYQERLFEGKARIREGGVRTDAIRMSPENRVKIAPPSPGGFTPQTRMGFYGDNE